MGSITDLVFGPRLHRIFDQPERQPNIVEQIGNHSMTLGRGLFYFSTSLAFGPILFAYLYSRGIFTPSTTGVLLRYTAYLGVMAFGARAIGRAMDSDYLQFLPVWRKAKDSGKPEDNVALKKYDFDLAGINADYVAVSNPKLWYLVAKVDDDKMIKSALAWYAVHAFGRHMLYPGSIGLLNWLLGQNLQQARTLMVNVKHGQRAWIRTSEGDLIDAMYIQGEALDTQIQKTLVICCEGNAGFYEIGVANTPAQLGYSVLGWNHPGFAGSSGLPFPNNTLASADAVMQYAMNVLGYREEDIVLFGWSIGGYPASWLAVNYPKVRGLVLDATFDDVLPLAEAKMPKFLDKIVLFAIRKYFNLEIHSILRKYKGPVRLIRRLQEEMLVTADDQATEDEKRATNRANWLLKYLLRDRHPDLVEGLEPQVDRWLALAPQERTMAGLNTASSEAGQRLTRLYHACDHYLTDFDANHVTPLSPGYFNIPMKIRLP